jgi:hypothetical protein
LAPPETPSHQNNSHQPDIRSHNEPMAENPSSPLEVVVLVRNGSWGWQVESEGTVLANGTGNSRVMAKFLGNDARLRLLAERDKAQE